MTLQYWQLAATFSINLLTLVLLFYKVSISLKTISGLSDNIINLETILQSIWKKDILKTNLAQGIQEIATESLRNNKFLPSDYHDIMMDWAERFEQLGKDAYYTNYRKKEGIEDFLNGKTDFMMSGIEGFMHQKIKGFVKFGKEKHSIVEYIKSNSHIYEEVKILVRTLVKNGLSDEKYIDLFKDFTRVQFNEGTKIFMDWIKETKIPE